MPRFIVKFKDKYMIFSTIVDAPVTYGMTIGELEDYVRMTHGQSGLDDLPKRLERVERYGSSSMGKRSAEDVMGFNRAGPNEDCLTMEEIYQAYVLRKPIRDGWEAK